MHVEAGGTSGTQVSLNDSDIRGMISKGSGVQMSFSEWYGASSTIIESSPKPDQTWWSGTELGTYDGTFPTGVKAFHYWLYGDQWSVEALFVTPFGWDNGNGWGTGITSNGFNPGVTMQTLDKAAIADSQFNYWEEYHGNSAIFHTTGRAPNYEFFINAQTGIAQQSDMQPYPYYAAGGWYYFFEYGAQALQLNFQYYGGWSATAYRTTSPTYPL